MSDIRSAVEAAIQSAMTDEAVKRAVSGFSNALAELESNFEEHLKTDIAYNLAMETERQADAAVEALLLGNLEEMRKRLHVQEGTYTGRDRDHPVIHGRLFETGALLLRKQIVDLHADTLKNERILDLEDQVASLVRQINKLSADLVESRTGRRGDE